MSSALTDVIMVIFRDGRTEQASQVVNFGDRNKHHFAHFILSFMTQIYNTVLKNYQSLLVGPRTDTQTKQEIYIFPLKNTIISGCWLCARHKKRWRSTSWEDTATHSLQTVRNAF